MADGRRRRIVVRVLAVVAVLVVAGVFAGGAFLVDFALNPHASFSMKSMTMEGSVDGLEFEPPLDADYIAEAKAWFEANKQSVSHVAEDGTELLGWEAPAAATDGAPYADGHTYTVLCHGYIGQPSDMAKFAYHFAQQGMRTLMPAARGHERNTDAGYIQMGWQDSADLVGWVNDVVAADPEARILLFGVSMGGAEVMMASGRDLPDNVRLIVEDCGYTSVWDEFSLQLGNVFHLPSFPLLNATDVVSRGVAGYSFAGASAVEQLRHATVPMLFIHGDADTFVPFSMLDEVYDACASAEKEKLVVPGAEHAQSSSTNPGLYWSTIDAFVGKHL